MTAVTVSRSVAAACATVSTRLDRAVVLETEGALGVTVALAVVLVVVTAGCGTVVSVVGTVVCAVSEDL